MHQARRQSWRSNKEPTQPLIARRVGLRELRDPHTLRIDAQLLSAERSLGLVALRRAGPHFDVLDNLCGKLAARLADGHQHDVAVSGSLADRRDVRLE